MPLRLLPILLPSHWTAADARGQPWNINPAHGPQRTVLDDVPTPTDQKAEALIYDLIVAVPWEKRNG